MYVILFCFRLKDLEVEKPKMMALRVSEKHVSFVLKICVSAAKAKNYASNSSMETAQPICISVMSLFSHSDMYDCEYDICGC